MTQTAPESALDGMAHGEAPVLESVLGMNLDALERCGLDVKTYFLVRLAALVAIDAPPMSYGMTLAVAQDELSLEDMQSVLVAIAPLVGTARVTAAAGNVLRAALGMEALAEAGTATVPEQRS